MSVRVLHVIIHTWKCVSAWPVSVHVFVHTHICSHVIVFHRVCTSICEHVTLCTNIGLCTSVIPPSLLHANLERRGWRVVLSTPPHVDIITLASQVWQETWN